MKSTNRIAQMFSLKAEALNADIDRKITLAKTDDDSAHPILSKRKQPTSWPVALAVLTGLLSVLLTTTVLRAETFQVNNFDDNSPNPSVCPKPPGICTLRAAIAASNANGQSNTIQLPKGDYKLNSDFQVNTGSTITILGDVNGGTIIHGNFFRVFNVQAGARLSLDYVTIRDAFNVDGGAIENRGSLYLHWSTVAGNHSHGTGAIANFNYLYVIYSTIGSNYGMDGAAGGIYNGSNGVIDLRYSTINNNSGVCAGGISNGERRGVVGSPSGGTVTILESTISGNNARVDETTCPSGAAGGILNGGDGNTTMENVTVVDNTIYSKSSVSGGVFSGYRPGRVYLWNSIIARNNRWAGDPSRQIFEPANCTLVDSLGGNVIGNNCQVDSPSSPKGSVIMSPAGEIDLKTLPAPPAKWAGKTGPWENADKKVDESAGDLGIGKLAYNGGNTCTIELKSGPAIGQGWTGVSAGPFRIDAYDQRMAARNGSSDSGSFKFGTSLVNQLGLKCN